MRSQTINNSDLGISNGTASFPEAYSFVFNPNYIEFDAGNTSYNQPLSVQVEGTDISTGKALSHSVEVSTYLGKARVYVSRLMQLMFTDYVKERCQLLTLRVLSGTTSIAADTVKAIWGGLEIPDLFAGPGSLNAPFRNWRIPHKRDLRWFRKFPFTVSMLRPQASGYQLEGRKDHGSWNDLNNSQEGIFEIDPSDDFSDAVYKAAYQIHFSNKNIVFDKTFDFTFHSEDDGRYETVNLEITDDDTAGYYLRWIDRFGFLEYWLFVQGDKTTKLSYGSDTIDAEQEYEGIYFGGMTRYVEVKSQTSIKASAVNLTKTQMYIVETICESSHVDLYCGKDKNGTELWLPVNISSGSYKTQAKKELQDLEITISLPDNTVQKL